jgi:hypothetical protein
MTGNGKKKAGRPALEPTENQRVTVSIMSACGTPQSEICKHIISPATGKKIDPKTLRKFFAAEIKQGKEIANSMVAQSLFKKATGKGQGAVTAAIFWLKTQAGWKESSVVENQHTGKGGKELPVLNVYLNGSEPT